MGVYIPNEKIPRNCIECKFQFGGWCSVAPPDVDDTKVAPTVDEAWKKGRPEWCPLMDVPDIHVGDMISRQAAIEAIEHRLADPEYLHNGEDWYVGMNCAECIISELPSVQPERRTGKWTESNPQSSDLCRLISCSECGKTYIVCMNVPYEDWIVKRYYCQNCGAKMEVE